jgi:hypothetical protein
METYEKHEFRDWPMSVPRELSEVPDLYLISLQLAAMVDAEMAAAAEPPVVADPVVKSKRSRPKGKKADLKNRKI